MNNQIQSEQAVEDQNPKQLTQLIKIVMLTPTQMLNLTSDDQKFTDKIIQYNEMGILQINNQDYNEALVYLQEAQKLLQYAASCGKTIDRILITSTLQNEACTYQRLWELDKSCNYMEAIIFNMNSYLDNGPQLEVQNHNLYSDPQFYEMVSLFVGKRLSIAFYYLQFSAVSSQTKKHDVALKNAFKALQTLKLICAHCYNYEQFMKKQSSSDEVLVINTVLKTLSTTHNDVNVDSYQKYLKETKRSIAKLRYRINQRSNTSDKTIQTLREFTIGEVMQISPVTIDEMNKKLSLKDEISFINKIYKAFYVSICYFAVATQLRLLSSEKYITEIQKKNCVQYRKSQIYHLNSIYVASMFSPCQSMYLEHILKSFKNHYDIDLNEASSVMEVSSIDVESQNFIEVDKGKSFPKQEECDFQNAQLKDHLKSSRKQKFHIVGTEKCVQNLKIVLKKKKKKNIILNPNHKKHELKLDLKHQKSKSNLKIPQKTRKNNPLIKSIDNTPKGKVRRKSSLSNHKQSKEHRHFATQKRIDTEKSKKSRKRNSEDKSKSKSKSKSKKSMKDASHGFKDKSKEKIKKKNAKLHEEYFFKNDKKKTKRKSISTHSLNKLRMSEYGDSVKGTFHTISISKMSNQKSNSRLGKNKN